MLTLNGKILNIYEAPKGVNRDTGEAYGGQNRIQLMCENMLRNGELRMELVDLSVDEVERYRGMVGQSVAVPVGVYVSSGKPFFYALKKQSAVVV
jgi:hypothetical protein